MSNILTDANQKVVDKIKAARPYLISVKPAAEVIPAFANRKLLLHAGPPIEYGDMTGPMRGACLGALIFEGWAKDEVEADRMLKGGEIEFIPCHSVSAVGPMGGITSPTMPVLVVKNDTDGNYAYCNMNEGIGKVMRFGAYGDEVQTRLC